MSAVDGTVRSGRAIGALVVVSTPIGNLGDLSRRALEVLGRADVICCEDTRHTGMLLHREGITGPRLLSLHGENEHARISEVLDLLAEGANIALVSDAGTPLVSDPGQRVVEQAIAIGAGVSVVPGPSAVLAALSVSGLAAARWRFEGFLPRKGKQRAERIRAIVIADEPSVLFESPKRVEQTLSDLAAHCGRERRVAVARELTKVHEEVWRGSLGGAVDAPAVRTARGEYVIVIEGHEGPARPSGSAVSDALEALANAGLGRRDAVAAVEALLGVGHKAAYAAALTREFRTSSGDTQEAMERSVR